MKRLIVMVALCGTLTSVCAQGVYRKALSQSQQMANNKDASLELRKIAQFKVDALNYMGMKTRQLMPDSSVVVLDRQALALSEYVALYVDELSKYTSKKARAYVASVFKDATNSNTRFGDMDRELVLSYYNNPNFLTRFSLDTDWVKALAEVKRKLASK